MRKEWMKRLVAALCLAGLLVGCNTIAGAGRDIRGAGEKIEGAARR